MTRLRHSCSDSAMDSEPPSACTRLRASLLGRRPLCFSQAGILLNMLAGGVLILALPYHRQLVHAQARDCLDPYLFQFSRRKRCHKQPKYHLE
jgi:hypothetical protein